MSRTQIGKWLAPQLRGSTTSAELHKLLFSAHGVQLPGLPPLILVEDEHEHVSADGARGLFVRGQPLRPELEALLALPGTRGVVVEYFPAELEAHLEEARQRRFSGAKLLQRLGYDAWEDYAERMELPTDPMLSRAFYGEAVGEVAARHGKVVYTADIADKVAYMLERQVFRTLGNLPRVGLLAPLQLALEGVRTVVSETRGPGALRLALLGAAVSEVDLPLSGGKDAPHAGRRGAFDPDRVSPLECITGGFEDARRVYLSMFMERILRHAQAQPNDGGRQQVVLVYPRAHVLRVVRYLTDPSAQVQLQRQVKAALFPLVAPGLDFHPDAWTHGKDGWRNTPLR